MGSIDRHGGAPHGPGVSDSDEPKRYDLWAPRAPEGRFDLGALLPGEGSLEVDIGFGRGASLYERAEVAPGSRVIGIEIKSKWAFKVEEEAKKRGLSNVRVLCGDARELLTRADGEESVERVFVHFPDPWWKQRHRKRRVVGQALLDELARLMRSGGELYVQTDVEDRAALYVETIREHPAFELLGDGGYVPSNPFGARSNREHRADEDGLPVYRILARRRAR